MTSNIGEPKTILRYNVYLGGCNTPLASLEYLMDAVITIGYWCELNHHDYMLKQLGSKVELWFCYSDTKYKYTIIENKSLRETLRTKRILHME